MALPKERTALEDFLVYGVDAKNRRIFFGNPIDWGSETPGDFTQASTEVAIRAIKRMESDHPKKPIEIYMNSYGGDTYSMLSLIDVILASKCQFKFYGSGAIMSSASWIMCVCDERYLYSNAVVMLHKGSDWTEGNHEDVKIDIDHASRLREDILDMYVQNSFMPKKFWDDVTQRDLYLSAEETIKLGLADFIVDKPKRGNLRKRRDHHMSKPPHHRTIKTLTKKVYERINLNLPSEELKIHVIEPTPKDPEVIVDTTPVIENVEILNEVKKEE